MSERDEQYVDLWANARVVGTTRYHCTDGEMTYRDKEGGEQGSQDESQCAELQRRLRSGIGAGANPNLR